MKQFFTTKRVCRAGIIAALYVALTCTFGALSYQGFLEVRPAEALCVLPLFFPEAIPALYIGCMLSNVISMYGAYDIFLGSLATLTAALCTYLTGRIVKNHVLRVFAGGLFPVLVNAFAVPLIIVALYGDTGGYATATAAYWAYFASMIATQSLWVYALGTPLYFFVLRMRRKGVSAFLDGKKRAAQTEEPSAEDAHA